MAPSVAVLWKALKLLMNVSSTVSSMLTPASGGLRVRRLFSSDSSRVLRDLANFGERMVVLRERASASLLTLHFTLKQAFVRFVVQSDSVCIL
jgi:hypothetical protein